MSQLPSTVKCSLGSTIWKDSYVAGARCTNTPSARANTSHGWIFQWPITCRPSGSIRRSRRRPLPNRLKVRAPETNMFDSASIIVGLEIGTSKVCAVVGEVNAAGALNIIGVGQCRSRGVRKGEITDATTTSEDVRNAIVEAEQMADVEIRSVYLGVTGGHIRGFTNRGVHPVVSADREITREDVE